MLSDDDKEKLMIDSSDLVHSIGEIWKEPHVWSQRNITTQHSVWGDLVNGKRSGGVDDLPLTPKESNFRAGSQDAFEPDSKAQSVQVLKRQ